MLTGALVVNSQAKANEWLPVLIAVVANNDKELADSARLQSPKWRIRSRPSSPLRSFIANTQARGRPTIANVCG